MMRRPKTNRVPRTRAGNTWTEAQFWSFLRSHLRLMSRRWPPRRAALLASRRPYTGPNKRLKWEHKCSGCGRWYKAADVQVDHIEPAGKLTSWEDVEPFIRRLLCEANGLQVLCKNKCHKAKTDK